MLRAPWADFEKVPTDWANVLSVMDWDVNLVAVHDLRDSANTCSCWARSRTAVPCFEAPVRIWSDWSGALSAVHWCTAWV